MNCPTLTQKRQPDFTEVDREGRTCLESSTRAQDGEEARLVLNLVPDQVRVVLHGVLHVAQIHLQQTPTCMVFKISSDF